MNLARSTDIDDVEYEQFLDGFAGRPGTALAYHYPFYLRFLSETAYPGSVLRFVTARNGRGDLIGVLPALNVKTPQLNVWLSLAYFGPNAGALVADADSAEGRAAVKALAAAGEVDARERECGSMTIYTPIAADPGAYRTGLEPIDFEVSRTTQSVTIPPNPKDSPWPRKVRYDIRRAA